VNGVRNEFLARTGFTSDEDGNVQRRNAIDAVKNLAQGR
jgi:hypothetical protein